MLKKWVKYLCDPIDKTDIKFESIQQLVGNDVISGMLKSKSGNLYPVKKGVPVFLNNITQSVGSVNSFGYEWNNFSYGKKSWPEDIVNPIVGNLKYFRNKVVIDCGAGSGSQSLWMAKAGAKFVFSIELSDRSIPIIKKITNKFKSKIFVIQADIEHLPIKIKSIKIDVAYCINVIQHTKNPTTATQEITSLLNPHSDFIFNIYLEKGRTNFISLLNFLRKFTRIVPHSLLKYFSYLITLFSYLFAQFPFIGGWFKKSLPLRHGFKETWLSVYDILGSHDFQKFYSEDELSFILKQCNLQIIKKTQYAMLLKMR